MTCPYCEGQDIRYSPVVRQGVTIPSEECRDCHRTWRTERAKLGRNGLVQHYGLTPEHVRAAERCVELMEGVILAPSSGQVGGVNGSHPVYRGRTPEEVAAEAAGSDPRTQMGVLALAVELYRDQVAAGDRVPLRRDSRTKGAAA